MSDEKYLKRVFKMRMGYDLNLDNPKTFNEKLNWLKLHDRNPEYTRMADKYEFKNYVTEKLGLGYVIPLLGVYNNFDEINFDELPEQFILKCTHDSGGFAICRDKKNFNIAEAKAILNKSLGKNYWWAAREWVYKNIKPRIIAEKYMQDGDNPNLTVYKIFNFNGVPKIIQAIQDDKTPQESIDYFDTDWNKLNLRQNFPNSITPLPKPELLEDMLKTAAKLSAGIPLVRTDLYIINHKIYFSEFTFYSDAGMAEFHPPEWDEILGSWIELPKLK